jgi:uncharacterized protein (DUF934 family)
MTVIVTDTGFQPAAEIETVTLADIASHKGALDLAQTDDPALVEPFLAELSLIRIAFPAFNDGRAFTIARRLRMMGYKGELRALGPVIADQYTMARRTGFDAVEIPDDLAARQPESQWQFRADWQAHDYQARLRA